MRSFLRRVGRLIEELKGREIPPVTVVYADGSKRIMDGGAAFHEICTNREAVKVHCENPGEQLFFDALGAGFDCTELWKDYGK